MINDLETRRRLSRLKAEALLLAQRFGEVRFDTESGTWFHVERFPIAPGWNKTHIELLIDIPHGTPGYPSVPPEWFWTDRDLRTKKRQPLNHFFTRGPGSDKEHHHQGWGHFCVHLIGWRPAGTDLRQGHSLATYLNLIAAIFRDRHTLSGGR
ncbi:MAG: hypothetical protein ACRDSR_09895 [Pseudonocardiaceae bacterium]